MRSVQSRTGTEAPAMDEVTFSIAALKTAAAYCLHVGNNGRSLTASESEDVQEVVGLILEGTGKMVATRAVEPEKRPAIEDFELRRFLPMRKAIGRSMFWKYYRDLYRVALKEAHTIADGFAARGQYRNARIAVPVVFSNLLIIGAAGVLAHIRLPHWSIEDALYRIAEMLVPEVQVAAAATGSR